MFALHVWVLNVSSIEYQPQDRPNSTHFTTGAGAYNYNYYSFK